MTRRTTRSILRPGLLAPVFTLAIMSILAAPVAGADDDVLVPVAPPEDHELTYNIPIQPWLVPAVLELKTEFTDGLVAEFTDVSENQTEEDLSTLVEAGRELAAAGDGVRESIRSIGELDVTYGLEGISRIIPAESALRDTLFGFVVWHEFSSAPARDMMTRFENMVNTVADGGAATGDLAESLASAQAELAEAVERDDAARIAELTPGIIQAAGRIDAVCSSVSTGAVKLGALVDSLSFDSGELLFEKWGEARERVARVAAPGERTGPALQSLSEVLHLVIGFGELLGDASSSVDALNADPAQDGNVYIPWTVMRNDFELVSGLEKRIIRRNLAGSGSNTGETTHDEAGEEGHEGHDHAADEGHEGHAHAEVDEYVGAAATEATKARISAMFPRQVDANALLAERAVEYTSARVWYAVDLLEKAAMDREGYSREQDQRQQSRTFENVDKSLRENMELMAAKMSMRAARLSLETARAYDARGTGYETEALYHYHNAWLHCLNAGASAQRSLGR